MRDDKNSSTFGTVVRDFAHNAAFSFFAGPVISGMLYAIDHRRFMDGVKEVLGSARGLKCNALVTLAVATVGTGLNALLGTGRFAKPSTAETAIEPPCALDAAPITAAGHAAREEARREAASTHAQVSR